MPEEERLSLVSEVEDEFTEPLQRLESALDSIDDTIRDTGRGRDHVRIDVEADTSDTVADLQALDAAVETLDDDATIDVDTNTDNVDDGLFQGGPNLTDEEATGVADFFNPKAAFRQTPGLGPDGGADATVGDGGDGGRTDQTFTVDNIDEWGEAIEPYFDPDAFGRRGGEVSNPDELLERDIEDVVDFERTIDLAIDDDHTEIDAGTLDSLSRGGPSGFVEAVDALDDADATVLGDNDGLRRKFKRFRTDLGDLRPTMRGWHSAVAAGIPLMGVFVGALPAAAVGLGALATAAIGAAGAMAAIGALGAAGISLSETGELSMEPITNRISEIGDSYLDAFAPLARSFAPVMENALSSIEAMSGPLATASTGLLAFRDEFQGLTSFLTSAIPSFTAELLAFTDAAMPFLSGVLSSLANVDVFGYLAAQLNQALPSLVLIGQSIQNILPFVVSLSQGFLAVAGVLLYTIGVVTGFLNQMPIVATAIGAVIGVMLTAVAVTGLWSIATGGLIGQTVGLASSVVSTLIPALNAQIGSMLGVAAASWQAYAATAAFLGLLTLGAVPIISALTSGFGQMGSNIKGARKELEKFANTDATVGAGGSGGSSIGQSSGSNPYVDNSTTVINAGDQDDAARQQYSSEYERQHIDSVFGG